jgi:hypothetical protein
MVAALFSLGSLLSGDIAYAKEKPNPARDARIALIRGLGQEVAVTKVAFPRGKHGIVVDAQGQLDKAKADEQMRLNGTALGPGSPVQITKMEFKSDRVSLELNGGGKKGKKWYQRIEVGVGTSTTPISPDQPTLAYGSSVTLILPKKIEGVTVEEVKRLLGSVLDFERHSPTVLYTPSVPPQFKEAIKNHQVLAGMDRDAVLSSKGPPDRKVREERNGVEQEDWIYGLPPHVLFVTFDGDRVVKVRQY